MARSRGTAESRIQAGRSSRTGRTGWAASDQSLPPSQCSCFQIGTVSFSVSIANRAASKASPRCGADATTSDRRLRERELAQGGAAAPAARRRASAAGSPRRSRVERRRRGVFVRLVSERGARRHGLRRGRGRLRGSRRRHPRVAWSPTPIAASVGSGSVGESDPVGRRRRVGGSFGHTTGMSGHRIEPAARPAASGPTLAGRARADRNGLRAVSYSSRHARRRRRGERAATPSARPGLVSPVRAGVDSGATAHCSAAAGRAAGLGRRRARTAHRHRRCASASSAWSARSPTPAPTATGSSARIATPWSSTPTPWPPWSRASAAASSPISVVPADGGEADGRPAPASWSAPDGSSPPPTCSSTARRPPSSPSAARSWPRKVVGVDPETDLALLKVDGADLVPARLATGDGLRIGQTRGRAGRRLRAPAAGSAPA